MEIRAQEVLDRCDDAVRSEVAALVDELGEVTRHADRLSALDDFEDELQQVQSKEEIFARTAACMRQLFDVQRASVALINRTRTTFDVYALQQDLHESTLVGSAIPLAGTAVHDVVDRGQLMNSSDISSSSYVDYRALHAVQMRSIMHAPLRVEGNVVGCLNMASGRLAAFDPRDEEILLGLARVIARGLNYRRLAAEVQSATEENRAAVAAASRLRSLNRIAHELRSAMSEGEVLDIVARLLPQVVPFVGGRIELVPRVASQPEVFVLRPGRLSVRKSDDVAPHVLDADFHSVVEAPLSIGGEPIGLLRLYNEDLHSYADRDQQLLAQSASLIVAAIQTIRLFEDAQRAQAMAEASSHAKSAFVANISHEIRTPLNAIIGMTSLLADVELDPRGRQYLETIRRSGEALLDVVSDVLDFSKIEANKIELEEHRFVLARCVEDVVDLFSAPASGKGIALSHDVDASLPIMVIGDATRLRQVLVNLVGNALKFTETGEISMSVSPFEGDEPDEGRFVRFVVRDTGIGMNSAFMESLFDPFVQEDHSMTRRFGGTGLGLAIARSLVELMGGRIWAESEPGRGSEFHFTVRLHEATQDEEDGQDRRPRSEVAGVVRLAETHPLRVLVAEDNKINQFVMLKLLERLGYRADIAADGVEVLDSLARQPYDVILMDMHMPQMDGLTAARRIRADRSSDRVQIVAVTANASQEGNEACLEAGMDDYLSKPVRLEHLVDALASAAGRIAALRARADESTS